MYAFRPIRLNSRPVRYPPANTLSMIRQLATPVQSRMTAPIRIASVEVSPIHPGIVPKNQSHGPPCVHCICDEPVSTAEAASVSGVAPEKPSTIPSPLVRPAIQIFSPEM